MRDRLQSQKCARYLKALADPDRLKIIQCLQSGPKTVTAMAQLLEKELANVSHHLGVLRHSQLVLDAKEGKFVVYSLNPAVFRPRGRDRIAETVDLGCCRLALGK
jgi:ArsR family transcriptional regulator